MRSSELAGEWETQSNDSCKGMETVRKATDQSRCHLSATYVTDAAQTAPTARLFAGYHNRLGSRGQQAVTKLLHATGVLSKQRGASPCFLAFSVYLTLSVREAQGTRRQEFDADVFQAARRTRHEH